MASPVDIVDGVALSNDGSGGESESSVSGCIAELGAVVDGGTIS